MVQDILSVVPQTPSMVVSTYRPEYQGPVARISGAQMIALTPLNDSESAALIASCWERPVGQRTREEHRRPAAGNPFFTEEIVRDLTERGVLQGNRGALVRSVDVADMSVPATLQAAIAARIDRLDADSKQTLNAAAVIGSRFTPELLTALGIDPVMDELARVELIDQVRFTPSAEYAVPPSADPYGGLRIPAQIRSCRAAPAPGGRDRIARPGGGRPERRVDRRTSRSRR